MTRRLAETDNEDRDVVWPTAQIGQIDEKTACLGGRQHAGDGADLGVGNLPAQAVAAQEVDVPRLDGMRAFQIHLHQRLGTERADDNVAGNARQPFRIDALPAGHFPDEAVIEAHLFDLAGADAIGPAVADVPDPGAVGTEEKGRGGGPHTAKFRVLLPLGVDAGVGFDKGLAQGGNAALRRVLVIGVRDDADRELTGQLADRMRSHAVGHEEDMPADGPLLVVAGEKRCVRVLVVTAANAHIGVACVLNLVESNHPVPAFIPGCRRGTREGNSS